MVMRVRVTVIMVLAALCGVAALAARDKRIEVDAETDFTIFRSFALRPGTASTRSPEVGNSLTLKRVEHVIRQRLATVGLNEPADRQDLIVTFSVTEGAQRGAPPRGQRGAVKLSAATLIIDMTSTSTGRLVWRGIYSDTTDAPATTADRLAPNARSLVSEFPPKKK